MGDKGRRGGLWEINRGLRGVGDGEDEQGMGKGRGGEGKDGQAMGDREGGVGEEVGKESGERYSCEIEREERIGEEGTVGKGIGRRGLSVYRTGE